MKYIVVGQSGIGTEIINNLVSNDHQVTVISTKPCKIDGVFKSVKKNITQEKEAQEAIEEIIKSEDDLPDYIINTVGVLYTKDSMPEKKTDQLTEDWLFQNIKINTLPTLYLTRYLTQKMTRNSEIKFFTFSAHVGCISDNTTGGWHSYRMSKCALNMLIRNISNEWKFKFPKSAIFGYHPGTVSTGTFTEFQKNISSDNILTPEKAAELCIENFSKLDLELSGKLIDFQGNELEY